MTRGFRARHGTCPSCRCDFALRADGLLRRHRTGLAGSRTRSPFCPGSLTAPVGGRW